MEKINLNVIFDRVKIKTEILDILDNFEKNKKSNLIKRGIYIYGGPGIGKSYFVKQILKEANYDIINYDAGNIRNKSIIDKITKDNMSDINVLSMFHKKKKNIAIVMDEIDGMNNGDKGGINALIKLIRPKKTKKQKQEESTMIPIICIGSYKFDKKIKEIMKVCNTIELPKPTNDQIQSLIDILMPNVETTLKCNLIKYIQGDIRKLLTTYNIYKNHESLLKNDLIQNMFQVKNYNEDTKEITNLLISNKYHINDHNLLMNETDRTSVGLLWHENIIDTFENKDKSKCIKFYYEFLNNICFSDYIDRITFQKQIWIFNEMSSLIKTFYNNYLYTKSNRENKHTLKKLDVVRFTKVLTKYSTEYNNTLFIQNLCKILNMDKPDLISYFYYLKQYKSSDEIYEIFINSNYDINKLDIDRFYRYIEYIEK